MPKILVILNPVSGTTNSAALYHEICKHFEQAGWEAVIFQTTGHENLGEVIQAHLQGGLDLVAAAGGDGTVSQVATHLAGTGIPLGVIPTGTWNALARNLGIPFLLSDALKLLTGPHSLLWLDALEAHDAYFLLNISTGFSSKIIGRTDRSAKRRFGFLAYIGNLVLQLFGIRVVGFHLIIDGKHRKVRGAAELMIVNSSLVGLGELPTTLNIHPDDGIVEVCVLTPRSIFGLAVTAWNIVIGGKNRHPEFRYFTARQSITIRSKRILDVQADGEMIGKTPLEIHVIPGSVKLIVPVR